ncbi:MAG: glycyl-tRNA synthetase beta subunit [Candidatus Xenolissoclinum pacificiensis L6]|uniref:glycine--tRNA ligase n=1 Tax=Candidatus Xenolissoclinum pacificiensis L6 TaxID=1401685 RepID=W2UYW7_9RICK|nr:MAG: glycyl-tRNA synthetase beta subunit [Candidatus Xenolissoclinum pacificiensis L6]
MGNFLFECLTEALPYKIQLFIVSDLERAFENCLQNSSIKYSELRIMCTSDRFVIYVQGVFLDFDQSTSVKGPSALLPKEILMNFLKKYNNKNYSEYSEKDVYVDSVNGKKFYFLRLSSDNYDLKNILRQIAESFLAGIKWPQEMRYLRDETTYHWVRPIVSMLCMLDTEIIPVEYNAVIAENRTFGNRLIKQEVIEIKSVDDYFESLTNNGVVVDHRERYDRIHKKISEVVDFQHYALSNSAEDVIKELSFNTDDPYVFIGNIMDHFMTLPRELIITVMTKYQHFIPLEDISVNELSALFVIVSNIDDKSVVKGYERVLKSRLEDVHFLILSDMKRSLQDYSDSLKHVMFYDKLGNMEDKKHRIISLSKFISVWVPDASILSIERASELAKADLATSLVKEFPDKKGFVGAMYAINESSDVRTAIKEHYYPVNASARCTQHPDAITLAISDRIDNIVGFFAVGKEPTANKDPYGLRRNALGIIRTLLMNHLSMPFDLVITKAVTNYASNNLFKRHIVSKIGKHDAENDKIYRGNVVGSVSEFMFERLKNYILFSIPNLNSEIFSAIEVFREDYYRYYLFVSEIHKFLNTEIGERTLGVFKRIVHLLRSHEKKKYKVSRKLFVEELESELYSVIMKYTPHVKNCKKNGDIQGILFCYSGELLDKLESFMNDIEVICDASNVANNRIGILHMVYKLYSKVIALDKLIYI